MTNDNCLRPCRLLTAAGNMDYSAQTPTGHERTRHHFNWGSDSTHRGGWIPLDDGSDFRSPGEYKLPHVTLKKTSGPALTAEQIGPLDAVLLSHDQHADNFDRSGKAYAMCAPRLFTTLAGAQRLGA